jgi:cytochrome b561
MKGGGGMHGTNKDVITTTSGPVEIYPAPARTLHWLVALLLAIQIPVGFYMAYRGNVLNLWDAMTNTMYSAHKLSGLTIFALVIIRFLYRLSVRPTITGWQHVVSSINHLALYALLLIMPVLGYLGVAYFPALDVFGFKLPALVEPNKQMSEEVFFWHMVGAYVLLALIALHVAAALYHYTIRGDNVLGRMLPAALRRT